MKRMLLLTAWLIVAFNSFAQPADSYLLGKMNEGNMPGANFAIIKNGHWVYSKSLGKADLAADKDVSRQTVFMMASVSKTMIATAIMQLWEKDLVDLDIDINHYLPFSVRTPSRPNDSITARMLLTHTSAIKDNWTVIGNLYVYGDSPVSLDSFLKNYFTPGGIYYSNTDNFYFYKPGSVNNYSNVGSTLAAYLVERITGDKFSHYCDTAIFQKLCMDNTSFLLSGIQDTTLIARPYYWNGAGYEDAGLYGYPDYPDGQLRTNITALARFMTMYMNNGTYEGTRILDSSTVDSVLKRQTGTSWKQGIIFYSTVGSNGDTLWGHNGGDAGVNTSMYFNRQKKTGVIVLTNGDGAAVTADFFADTLYKYGLTVTPNANDTFPPCTAVSVNDIAYTASDISMYPNPTKGSLQIHMPVKGSAIVTDIRGRLIHNYHLDAGSNSISLPASSAEGIYMVRITDVDGRLTDIRKLVLIR